MQIQRASKTNHRDRRRHLLIEQNQTNPTFDTKAAVKMTPESAII